MSRAAVLNRSTPKHGALQKAGPKKAVPVDHVPPWHSWNIKFEHERIVKWIESTIVLPVGQGGGEPMRVARFQRRDLKMICDALAAFFSVSAGNGKSTFMAAVALERICRGDSYVEVDVLATNEAQAARLVNTAVHMIESSPQLIDKFAFYKEGTILEYRLTGSTMRAHPAKLSSIQGLNPDLTLIDEISEVPSEIVTSMFARLGKKPGQRVIGFGTPGFGHDNMLEALRALAQGGELPDGVRFIEYAADPGCDLMDEMQWEKANPAIAAGFLDPASMSLKAATMPEHEFRAYHLGQPVEASGPWLPYGAWDACYKAEPPPDGTPIVLALWGNYRRQATLVGATPDGSLFFGWRSERASDEHIEEAVCAAAEQWEVVDFVHKPHIRLGLMAKLEEQGLPVTSWPADAATDKDSTAAFYQAIADSEVAHDHDELLSHQISRLTAKIDNQGNPRLVESSDPDVSVALAARAAWWRAKCLADSLVGGEINVW